MRHTPWGVRVDGLTESRKLHTRTVYVASLPHAGAKREEVVRSLVQVVAVPILFGKLDFVARRRQSEHPSSALHVAPCRVTTGAPVCTHVPFLHADPAAEDTFVVASLLHQQEVVCAVAPGVEGGRTPPMGFARVAQLVPVGSRLMTGGWRSVRFRLAPRTCDASHPYVGPQRVC